jgi:PAS domain S-box-containing protein
MTFTESLFRFSPLPMWVYNAKTLKFLSVNLEAVRKYSYTEQEFLGMSVNDLRIVEEVQLLKIEDAVFIDGIYTHLKKDKSRISVRLQSSAVEYNGAEAMLVVATDITAQLLDESALKLNERKFKVLVQDGMDMVAIIGADFKYIYLNPSSEQFYIREHSAGSLIGTSVLDKIHEQDRAGVLAEFNMVPAMKQLQLSPFRLKNYAGEYRWIETSVTDLQTDPAIGGILCNSRDVTERIENDEKMRLNIERYNIISKATSDTIWDWNLSTNTIIWNKGINGIFGHKNLKDNTTTGDWWAMQIHPDDRDRVWNNIQQHIQDKKSRWVDEYRFICADGTYRYVSDRGFMVFDEHGESIRMIGSLQDISQRKQEEQWSRLLESVVINATDAVQICTGNIEGSGQSIIYVNEAFTRMSGYTKFELIGASPRISQGPETDINEIRRLKDAIESKLPCEIEVINYTKQGKEYWVSQSNAPIADSSGEITHWISIQRDITQNRKHLQEIEDQNKKFREIAWIQSHLVRAPLARIMGLVDLLQSFVPGDDKDQLLVHLTSSARELDAIIINIADKTPADKI